MFTVDLGSSSANVRAIAAGLSRWSGDIRSTREVLERVRDQVGVPAVSKNFIAQGHGNWAPLSWATPKMPPRRDVNPSAPILIVRGRLLRAAVAKARWTVKGQEGNLFVKSDTFAGNVPYGHFQHEGGVSPLTGSQVPARPFFYFTPEDIALASTIIDEWAAENFDKRIGLKAAATTVGSVIS